MPTTKRLGKEPLSNMPQDGIQECIWWSVLMHRHVMQNQGRACVDHIRRFYLDLSISERNLLAGLQLISDRVLLTKRAALPAPSPPQRRRAHFFDSPYYFYRGISEFECMIAVQPTNAYALRRSELIEIQGEVGEVGQDRFPLN
jgi:hypothetical protein